MSSYSEKVVDDTITEAMERIQAKIAEYRTEIDECHAQMTTLQKWEADLRKAVLAGHWWKLKGVLTNAQIELLSEIEPADRSELLGAWRN